MKKKEEQPKTEGMTMLFDFEVIRNDNPDSNIPYYLRGPHAVYGAAFSRISLNISMRLHQAAGFARSGDTGTLQTKTKNLKLQLRTPFFKGALTN